MTDDAANGDPVPILGGYSSGMYAREYPVADDDFKAQAFLSLFDRVACVYKFEPASYIDVGCLTGGVVEAVANGLRNRGYPLSKVKGYDVAPQMREIARPGIDYVHGDFTTSEERVDLVTLFDVLEHVLRPIDFVRAIADRCLCLGVHIPLDDSVVNGLANRFQSRLNYPGHLIYLNPASALTLLAYCGLRVITYEYTLGFQAPSGSLTRKQRALKPLRSAVARLSPWATSRLLGGVSLMVLCATERGLRLVPAFDDLRPDITTYLNH